MDTLESLKALESEYSRIAKKAEERLKIVRGDNRICTRGEAEESDKREDRRGWKTRRNLINRRFEATD